MPDRPEARVVFATRKFPPSTGGMETLAAATWQALSGAFPDARLVAHGGANRGLLRWLPGAAREVRGALHAGAEHLVIGDALLTALLVPVVASLPRARRPRVTSLVMGLDLTWGLPGYRPVVRAALRRSTAVAAISAATADQARRLGLDPSRVHVLTLGIDLPAVDEADRERARRAVRDRYGPGTRVLATVGRLVERKGAAWFAAEVLPRLGPEVHYVLAGAGPHEAAIRDAARAAGVEGRVHLLGLVDESDRDELLAGADVFVQPNIPVPGDMEGFGLVVIEAAGRGTPVVAADLEGLRDAVVDGVTGQLVPAADPAAWVAAVGALLELPEAELRALGAEREAACRQRYGLARMTAELLAVMAG